MVNSGEKWVDLNTVDMDDDLYRISSTESVAALADSIGSIGLVNLPILEEKAPNLFRIVCGFKRLLACRVIGMETVRCRVISSACSPMTCLTLAIADNTMGPKPPGILDQARAVDKIRSFCDNGEDLSLIAGRLGLHVDHSLVEKYVRLCSLPAYLQQLVEDDVVSMAIAIELGALEDRDAMALSGLFDALRPTASQQKELLSALKAISVLHDTDMAAILELPELSGIMENDAFDRKQKIQNVRQAIRKRRYPVITRFESHFRQQVLRLNLPRGMALMAPRDFESPLYTLTIDFRDSIELRQHAETIESLCGSSALKSLFRRDIENT